MAKKKITWWKAIGATLLFVGLVYMVFYHHKQITRYYYKAYRLYQRAHRRPPADSVEAIPFPEGFNIHGIELVPMCDRVPTIEVIFRNRHFDFALTWLERQSNIESGK